VGLESEFEGLVDVIDVVNDVLCVTVGRVFTLNYLALSLAPIR